MIIQHAPARLQLICPSLPTALVQLSSVWLRCSLMNSGMPGANAVLSAGGERNPYRTRLSLDSNCDSVDGPTWETDVNTIASCFVAQCAHAIVSSTHWYYNLAGTTQAIMAYLVSTSTVIAASNSDYQTTPSRRNWLDVRNTNRHSRDPVLHGEALMDTMSPRLFGVNGEMKWVVCQGGDGCHKDEGAERHFPAHLSDSVICADTFIAVSHPWTSGNYCGKSWYSVWPCQRKFITWGEEGRWVLKIARIHEGCWDACFFKGRYRTSEGKRRSVQNWRSFSDENTKSSCLQQHCGLGSD